MGGRITGHGCNTARKTEREHLQVDISYVFLFVSLLLIFPPPLPPHFCVCMHVLYIFFRPGLIGPHRDTGHANLQDWVCWLVRGCVRVGLVPTGQGCDNKEIHWVPVDQVAKAIILISSEVNRGL